HIVAGAGVYKHNDKYLWAALTHAGTEDVYRATVSLLEDGGTTKSIPLDSSQGRNLIAQAKLLGFVEGTSRGHISARGRVDPADAFNGWPRQEYDADANSDARGGTVWEHWCTTRDIRAAQPVGDSVIKAYVTLASTLGGKFVAAVIRGRVQHEHPVQLCGLVKGGFITKEEALWDITPHAIPDAAESMFLEARPADSIKAVATLEWDTSGGLRYYMFKRKIEFWNKTEKVAKDLREFGL
ncbi:MAG: hypothetical protein JSU64_01960, partial [candidate division WOR-3 bacterium]